MKRQSVARQTVVLTCANALVRALGFALHVALSRMLGAEALGLMELSHSAHLLSIVPVTAGLPAAISRLTALRRDASALRAGRSLALRISAVLIPLWVILSPTLARLLGDDRVLPLLWIFTPCIAVLGLSAVYNGYCYGLGKAWPPALSTLTEQALRFALTAGALALLPALSVTARAAIPGAATLAAEAAALLLTVALLRRACVPLRAPANDALRGEILRLSLPITGTRLVQSLSRPVMAALLPRLLVKSGLTATQSTASLGMLQGMVLPVLYLPGIFTMALGMMGTPAIARRQGEALRGMALRVLGVSLACGVLGGGAVYALSSFLESRVYHVAGLAGLFRAAAPLTLLFALQQAAGTLLSGLGLQKKTLLPTLGGTALSLILLPRWAASPLRLYGAVYALIMGRAAALLWQLAQVLRALSAPPAALAGRSGD